MNYLRLLKIVGFALLFVITIYGASAEVFDGDTVYINDSKAYISATPHTLTGSGYVYFDVESKLFTGDVNMLFGYNGEYVIPKSFEYYNPHNETVTKSYICDQNFNYTLGPNYFWCYNESGVVFEHSFDTGNISAKTAYWDEIVHKDWSVVPGDYSHLTYSFDGKNDWYYVQNIPLNQGVRYQARAWLEAPSVPFGKTVDEVYPGYDPKYDIAFYPSSYGSDIDSAIINNHFYFLDPVVNLTSGVVTNYKFESDGVDSLNINNMSALDSPTHGSGGIIGNYVSFDGTNDGYRNLSFTGLDSGTGISVSFWHNKTSCPSAEIPLILRDSAQSEYFQVNWKDNSGDGSGDGCDMRVEYTDAGSLARAFTWTDGFSVDGNWHMITVVLANGANNALMYEDGVVMINETGYTPRNDWTRLWISNYEPAALYYAWNFDELSLWDKALNYDEVQAIYNNESTGTGYPWANAASNTTSNINSFIPYAINSSNEVLGGIEQFNTANLTTIEKLRINFSVSDADNISDVRLYFTANGTDACALGNRQSTTCLSFNNFIHFINNSITNYYDGTSSGGNQGDVISCSFTGNATNRDYTCDIDEHYNPNVFKWYSAEYNFSDVKWQNGNNQKITKNNILKIELNNSIIPLNASYYKLDFRAQPTNNPTQPLLAYACNSSYTTGDPVISNNCVLIAEKSPSDFQDDGTKFRATFSGGNINDFLNNISDFKYILLLSDEVNPSRYYALKTYASTVGGWSTKWNYSTNNGDSFVNLGDGYESELNINWFNSDTESLWKVEVIDGNNESVNSSLYNVSWDIASMNNPPLVVITDPANNATISGTYNILFSIFDESNNTHKTNLTFDGDLLLTNFGGVSGNYSFNTKDYSDGTYTLNVTSCENNTADFYCGFDIHTINIDNAEAPTITTALSISPDPVSRTVATTISVSCTPDTSFGASINNVTLTITKGLVTDTINMTLLSGYDYSSDYIASGSAGEYTASIICYDNEGNNVTSSNTFNVFEPINIGGGSSGTGIVLEDDFFVPFNISLSNNVLLIDKNHFVELLITNTNINDYDVFVGLSNDIDEELINKITFVNQSFVVNKATNEGLVITNNGLFINTVDLEPDFYNLKISLLVDDEHYVYDLPFEVTDKSFLQDMKLPIIGIISLLAVLGLLWYIIME